MENLCGRNKTLYFGLNVAVCVSLPKRGTKQGSTAGGSLGKFNTSLFWAVFSTCHLDLSPMNEGDGAACLAGGVCFSLSVTAFAFFHFKDLVANMAWASCGTPVPGSCGPGVQPENTKTHTLCMAAIAYFCSKVSVLRIFIYHCGRKKQIYTTILSAKSFISPYPNVLILNTCLHWMVLQKKAGYLISYFSGLALLCWPGLLLSLAWLPDLSHDFLQTNSDCNYW